MPCPDLSCLARCCLIAKFLSSSLKNFARANRPPRCDSLFVQLFSADGITQHDRLVGHLQHRNVRFAPYFETTDAGLPTNGAGRIDGALRNNLIEAQTKRQELGQHARQIADDSEARLAQATMQIRADDVRSDAFAHRALNEIEIEMAAGM